MKKALHVTWDGTRDATGYLFSLAKSLSAAVRHSPYNRKAEDIVATSGFAFRMWVSADLCPSATSIWDFDSQPAWVENGGLLCGYVGRYWGEDAIEEKRRLEALALIKESIDRGIPAVSWDIGVPEWGLVTGYDEGEQQLFVLPINGEKADPTSPGSHFHKMPYGLLGKRELPILSVLTLQGESEKTEREILQDTKRLAVRHLTGGEWCENTRGLAAYDTLVGIFEGNPELSASWNAEYFLGAYGALKEYAWRYFEKMGEKELAALYKDIFDAWMGAFRTKTTEDAGNEVHRTRIAALLREAQTKETEAVKRMQEP